MAESGMRFQLEQSTKSAWEREEEARRWEHDMEMLMREQSRRIDQIEVELKHAQDINEVELKGSLVQVVVLAACKPRGHRFERWPLYIARCVGKTFR